MTSPWALLLAVPGAAALAWSVALLLSPRGRPRAANPAPGTLRRRLRAGSSWRRGPLALGLGAGGLAYLLLGLWAPSLVIGGLGTALSFSGWRWRESRKRAQMGAALLAVVDLLGQLLPAGHSTRQALTVLAESGPVELREEIRTVLGRLDRVSLEVALVEAQERLRQPLFTLVSSALIVGSRSGGRMAPLILELSRAAHQMAAVQGKLRAEQAQGRLGALVIALMPVALLGVLHLVNPEYLAPYATLRGELVLGGLTALILVGYGWMLRLLRIPEPDLLPLVGRPAPSEAARRSLRSPPAAARPPAVVSSPELTRAGR